MYRNYDLKANLDTKLRIRNHSDNLTSYGHFDINNIKGIILTKSNLIKSNKLKLVIKFIYNPTG